jgi:hypothetical protein
MWWCAKHDNHQTPTPTSPPGQPAQRQHCLPAVRAAETHGRRIEVPGALGVRWVRDRTAKTESEGHEMTTQTEAQQPAAQPAVPRAFEYQNPMTGHVFLSYDDNADLRLLIAEKGYVKEPLYKSQPAAQPTEPAYTEAVSLATALFKKHFAHEEHYASGRIVWEPCDTTAGVISQIDNMVSGLIQPAVRQEPSGEPVAWAIFTDAGNVRPRH